MSRYIKENYTNENYIKGNYIREKRVCGNNVFFSLCVLLFEIFYFYTFAFQYRVKVIPMALAILTVCIVIIQTFFINNGTICMESCVIFHVPCTLYITSIILMDLIGLISCPIMNDQIESIVKTTMYMIVLLSIVFMSDTSDHYVQVLYGLFIVMSAICVWFAVSPQIYLGTSQTGRYSLASNYNPNGLGFLINLGLWAALYLFNAKKVNFISLFAYIAIGFYCTILTGSRKSLLCSIACLFLYFVLVYFPGLKRQSSIYRLFSITIVIVAICFGFRYGMTIYNTSSMNSRMGEAIYEITLGERGQLYKFGLSLFKKHWLLGVGYNGYQYYQGIEYSHSTIIESMVSGGIIPFCVYWLSLYKSCVFFFKYIGFSETINKEYRMMGIILIALIFFTGLGTSHITGINSYVMIGYLFGLIRWMQNERMNNGYDNEKI